MLLILGLLVAQAQAEPYRFTLKADKTYTASEKEMLKKVERKINELSVSECFQSWFTDGKKRSKLLRTNGKSRAEVAKHFRTATQHGRVTMYYTSKDVIGYRSTTKEPDLIHTNSKYYRDTKPWNGKVCPRASNAFHELSHLMGYGHDFNRTPNRPYSVPYTVTAAVNACCKEAR